MLGVACRSFLSSQSLTRQCIGNRIRHNALPSAEIRKCFCSSATNDTERVAERYVKATSWTVADVLMQLEANSGKSTSAELHTRIIDERQNASEAARNMVLSNSGSLIVVREEKGDERSKRRLVGIVTERDYIRKIVLEDRQPKQTTVKEIMTEADKVKVVTPLHTIQEAMTLMRRHQFRNLPVVSPRRLDEQDELLVLALISQRDLINYYVQYHEDSMQYLSSMVEFPIW